MGVLHWDSIEECELAPLPRTLTSLNNITGTDILTGSGADVAAVAAEPMEFAAKVARLDAMTEIQSERGLDQCS